MKLNKGKEADPIAMGKVLAPRLGCNVTDAGEFSAGEFSPIPLTTILPCGRWTSPRVQASPVCEVALDRGACYDCEPKGLWRLRAEELRLLAGTVEDASARLGVLHAARNYDAMAAEAKPV